MTYVLILCALVGTFIWASPARNEAPKAVQDSFSTVASAAKEFAAPLAGRGSQLLATIREKAMILLRKELHDAIDEKVK